MFFFLFFSFNFKGNAIKIRPSAPLRLQSVVISGRGGKKEKLVKHMKTKNEASSFSEIEHVTASAGNQPGAPSGVRKR